MRLALQERSLYLIVWLALNYEYGKPFLMHSINCPNGLQPMASPAIRKCLQIQLESPANSQCACYVYSEGPGAGTGAGTIWGTLETITTSVKSGLVSGGATVGLFSLPATQSIISHCIANGLVAVKIFRVMTAPPTTILATVQLST
jgi:hypothetical protein